MAQPAALSRLHLVARTAQELSQLYAKSNYKHSWPAGHFVSEAVSRDVGVNGRYIAVGSGAIPRDQNVG